MQSTIAVTTPTVKAAKKVGIVQKILRNLQIAVGGTIIATFVLMAIFAPAIAPQDPLSIAVQRRLQGPSEAHVLGTDELGRDVLSRLIHGARISLMVGVVSTVMGGTAGVILGIIAGYYGSFVDSILGRIIDIMMALPGMLLALAILTILGAGTFNTIIAISIFAIPTFARITRGSTLNIKKLEYVDAIRAIGATDFRIITRHIFPNIVSPIIVQATLYVATAIVIAASLSFLGMGTQPPTPEWGTMLSNGREFMRQAPHLTLYPGIMILLVVLGFNLIGDGLRHLLEPKK